VRSFLFLCGEFFQSLAQNRFLHFTYAVQVTTSLLVLGIFFVLLVGGAAWWGKLGSYMRIHVFLNEGLSAQQVVQIEERLTNLTHVTGVEYRSKEYALELLSRQAPDLKLDSVDNPLPASFVLSVDRPGNIQAVAENVGGMVEVQNLRYGKDVLQSYLKVLMILMVVCVVTITLLVVFTSSSISNIIGMSVYARRTEIRIMQLVGATRWFIRWPFLFEGVFFGVVGAVAAIIIIIFIMAMLAEALRFSNMTLALPALGLDTSGLMVVLLVVMVGLGTFIGFFGSLKAVNSFLRKEDDVRLGRLKSK
jgi:cell division transport system permease protein